MKTINGVQFEHKDDMWDGSWWAIVDGKKIWAGNGNEPNIGFLPSKVRKQMAANKQDTVVEVGNDAKRQFEEAFGHLRGPNKEPRTDEPDDDTDIEDTQDMDDIPGDSQSNPPPSTNMDMDVETTAAGTRSFGPSNTGTGNHETQVSPYPRIERNPFSETRTVALNHTAYFSAMRVDKTSPVVLRVRLNSPYEFYKNNVLTAQTINSNKTKGLSNCCSQEFNAQNPQTFNLNNQFPSTIIGSVAKTATETSSGAIPAAHVRPAFQTHYDAMYENYHLVQTNYVIELESATNDGNCQSYCFEYDNVYTLSSAGQEIPQGETLSNYLKYPHLKTHRFGGRRIGDPTEKYYRKTLKGTWTYNKFHHNVRNDDNIKTWYPVGAEPTPEWVEEKMLLFMSDDFAQGEGGGSGRGKMSFNIKVHLEFIVQYKDLQRNSRFPLLGDANQVLLTMPSMAFQVPTAIESVP